MEIQSLERGLSESFTDSTPFLGDSEALAAAAAQDGYLFFKQLLPKEPVLELRRQILAVAEKYGWVIPGTDGQCDLEEVHRIPGSDLALHIPRHAYADVQRLELFHRLPHHPALIRAYEAILGGRVLPHPRCIARVVLPHREAAPTPAHQDYTHIQGSRAFWTCWFPLGDCPRKLGGLAVLKGSHRGGLRAVAPAAGAGGLAAEVCPGEQVWVGGDFAAGDVLTFPSLTVHKALLNQFPATIRLSCDNRYQAADEPVEQRSLEVHGHVLPWEEVYRDWEKDDLKYYWRKLDLTLSGWDENLRWQKEKIC